MATLPAPCRISTFGQVLRLVAAPVVTAGAGALPLAIACVKRSPKDEPPVPPDEEQPAASTNAASGAKRMMRQPPPVSRRMTCSCPPPVRRVPDRPKPRGGYINGTMAGPRHVAGLRRSMVNRRAGAHKAGDP